MSGAENAVVTATSPVTVGSLSCPDRGEGPFRSPSAAVWEGTIASSLRPQGQGDHIWGGRGQGHRM